MESLKMSGSHGTDLDTERARRYWAQYQRQYDVSDRIGETAGIDPGSGRVWFGSSAKDIVAQMEVEGVIVPLYFVRIGFDYYLRKGASW
jgi:hypothetical protein